MEWLMAAALAVGVIGMVPVVRRRHVRRRSVARARREMSWFYVPPQERSYVRGCGKHASAEPIVVLRRLDGSPLGRVPRPGKMRYR